MKIIFYPDPKLSLKCEEVIFFDKELHDNLDSMKRVMVLHKGMGLSANQVGINKRFLIIRINSGEILELINPEITFKEGFANLSEGCLSMPGVFGKIHTRSDIVEVKFSDRFGTLQRCLFSGIEAVCIQHEVDHLDGVFWIERLPNRDQKRSKLKEWNRLRKKLK